MYCSKCGKEIPDDAVICMGCGCATSNFNNQAPTQNTMTQNAMPQDNNQYLLQAITDYEQKVNNLFTFSILSWVLFILIIPYFIIAANLPKVPTPINDPMLEKRYLYAVNKAKKASIIASIACAAYFFAILELVIFPLL